MRDIHSEPLTPDERWEAIERICGSNELKRAARLREFLHFVGQKAIHGENVQVSESEIGVHVFNRPENYDTSSDNIVRVNASELRKRITAYYASEGADEKILVQIPRGSYAPQFSLRSAYPALPLEEGNTGRNSLKTFFRTILQWFTTRGNAAIVVATVLACTCLYLVYQNHRQQERIYSWKSEPTLGPFWTNLLGSSRGTDVVLADISVSTVEFILKQNISLSGYLNHAYDEQIQTSSLSPELKSDLKDLVARHDGSVGDFRVAQKIIDLNPDSQNVQMQFAREYKPRSATEHNLILIGSSVSNPWTSLFNSQLNFVIGYDSTMRQMVVQNRKPQANENAVYAAPADSTNIAFSLIDYLPNQNDSADVLIIAGTNSVATEAAGDFLTREDSLRRVADLFHSRKLPHFELLLKTTRLQGAPIAAEIVAYRRLSNAPLDVH